MQLKATDLCCCKSYDADTMNIPKVCKGSPPKIKPVIFGETLPNIGGWGG